MMHDEQLFEVDPSKLKPLGECSKVLEEEGVSEWMMNYAMESLRGKPFSQNDFYRAIKAAEFAQSMGTLVEEGIVEVTWDHEKGEPLFSLTEKGKKEAATIEDLDTEEDSADDWKGE